MRIAPLALAGLLLLAPAVPAADDADVVVTKWLVLPAVDQVARRKLRADAVFAKHLLDRASPPPKAGDEITGTLGKPAKWTAREAAKSDDPKKNDFVEADGIGWSYASVESAADRVALAKLEGAGVLYVNGAGFAGDSYGLGDAGVPVALRKGANDVYVAGPRGGFKLTLLAPPRASVTGRITFPDWDVGTPWSIDVLNASNSEAPTAVGGTRSLVPLGVGRADFVQPTKYALSGSATHFRQFSLPNGDSMGLSVSKKGPGDPIRRTFVSNIDGSVQSYALVRPSASDLDKSKIGLVLSLHGAGVDCMSQAKSYAPKPDFWIVCPTNRGRYGFDWQDWGRLDALEVLTHALVATSVVPRSVYLTGHSMGGHGTWHLAANEPDGFLAIAPSAGWSCFENYSAPKMTTPLASLWRAADGASQTLELVQNLAQVPAYVLHGEKDDNVPASEARLMIDAVTKAGGKVESHFEPDAEHWWDKDKERPGADCVDWPGIWELFRKTGIPEHAPFEVTFTTADLSVNAADHWIEVAQAIEYGKPCRIAAKWDRNEFIGITTENVRRFRISFGPWWVEVKSLTVTVDGQRLALGTEIQDYERDAAGNWLQRVPAETRVPPSQKRPGRGGPFKRAFDNMFVLVYGTAGDDAEDKELLEKSRYDSEVWAYRANGDANLMSDEQFLAAKSLDGRNVILYGNADTNRAWSAVFDDDCPIQAKRGAMTVNGTKHEGVVAAAFVRPRKGSDVALAAAFADTGAAATRLFYAFPVFSSGVGIPDYVVFGPGFLREWDGDVRAAGWFDHAWRMR